MRSPPNQPEGRCGWVRGGGQRAAAVGGTRGRRGSVSVIAKRPVGVVGAGRAHRDGERAQDAVAAAKLRGPRSRGRRRSCSGSSPLAAARDRASPSRAAPLGKRGVGTPAHAPWWRNTASTVGEPNGVREPSVLTTFAAGRGANRDPSAVAEARRSAGRDGTSARAGAACALAAAAQPAGPTPGSPLSQSEPLPEETAQATAAPDQGQQGQGPDRPRCPAHG